MNQMIGGATISQVLSFLLTLLRQSVKLKGYAEQS
jgi:hypothetical protein